MKKRLLTVAAGLCLLASPSAAMAQDGEPSARPAEERAVPGFRSTDLPLPRFVSLKSDKIYVRAGPALRYPIRWIYTKEGLPVEIIQEFEAWRKVRDYGGEEGWVHQSLLSGARTAFIAAEEPVPMQERAAPTSRLTARLEPRVLVAIDRCEPSWCRVEAHGYEGWVERKFLWGIYEDEEFH